MIKIIISLIVGYIIGEVLAYRRNRKQCLNCGGHNTENLASGHSDGGGEYKYAVCHWEGYRCKDCGKFFSATIKLDK